MSRRVLVVDDEPTVAGTLGEIFGLDGYETQTASSAEDALELITRWEPDVAIVDVILPDMTGIDLGKHLHTSHPNCKLLFISGQTCTSELLENALNDGHAFEVLAKPIHPAVLLKNVSELLKPGVEQTTTVSPNKSGGSNSELAA